MSIRVAIVDDHPMILEGFRNLIHTSGHLELAGAYLNFEALQEGLKLSVPDVLLLDVQLPGKNGDEIAAAILPLYPEMKILALTNVDYVLHVYNMLRTGVSGYVLKNAPPATILEAIGKVYNNETYVDASLKDALQEFTIKMKKESFLKPRLSQRETEVLQLIADGDSSHEIAEKLFISVRTVEYYRLNILLKMDVKNTAALIRKALSSGLIK